jgi:hypothetical protein
MPTIIPQFILSYLSAAAGRVNYTLLLPTFSSLQASTLSFSYSLLVLLCLLCWLLLISLGSKHWNFLELKPYTCFLL